jgi:hypothetical protein
VVFRHAGERYTQAIPREISEPDLHALIRRMFGLEEGRSGVRYGGRGPFRVQPQMSIKVTRTEQMGTEKGDPGRITMQRWHKRQQVEVDGEWNEQRLKEKSQRRWPNLGKFTLRYGESVDFQVWEGITVWISEQAQGPAEECVVSIKYYNKCWTNKIATEASAEDSIGIARRFWRIPEKRQLTVRESQGRMKPHLGAEYLVETERHAPPEGHREVEVSCDLVLENGPDVMSSSDEDSPNEEHGDALEGVYTHGCKAPVLLSRLEVARQKAAAEGFKNIGCAKWISSEAHSSTASSTDVPSSDVPPVSDSLSDDSSQTSYRTSRNPFNVSSDTGESTAAESMTPSRFGTPVNSDNEDQEEMSEDHRRCLAHGKKNGLKAASRPAVSEASPTIARSQSGSIFDTPLKTAQPPRSQTPTTSDPPRATATASLSPDPPSPKGPRPRPAARPAESEAAHPMATGSKDASRAGSLRPGVGGLGKKDTRVASSHPSQT